MAKEKAAKQAATAKEAAPTRRGVISCVCNRCGEQVDVPTHRLYAKVAPAIPAQGEIKVPALRDPKTNEVLKEAYTVPAKPYANRYPLVHNDISGGGCTGTFRTVQRPKAKKG